MRVSRYRGKCGNLRYRPEGVLLSLCWLQCFWAESPRPRDTSRRECGGYRETASWVTAHSTWDKNTHPCASTHICIIVALPKRHQKYSQNHWEVYGRKVSWIKSLKLSFEKARIHPTIKLRHILANSLNLKSKEGLPWTSRWRKANHLKTTTTTLKLALNWPQQCSMPEDTEAMSTIVSKTTLGHLCVLNPGRLLSAPCTPIGKERQAFSRMSQFREHDIKELWGQGMGWGRMESGWRWSKQKKLEPVYQSLVIGAATQTSWESLLEIKALGPHLRPTAPKSAI